MLGVTRSLSLVLLLSLPACALVAHDRASILRLARSSVPGASVKIVAATRSLVRVRLVRPGLDPAFEYLRNEAGRWRIIAGPGTAWTPHELDRLRIPRSLR